MLFVCLCFLSCSTLKKTKQESGKVVVQKESGNPDSSIIKGSVFDMLDKKKIQVSDIWIDDARYPCDSNGDFRISLQSGKYQLLGRGFSYKSYQYNLKIKRGDLIKVFFYLVPVKFSDNE